MLLPPCARRTAPLRPVQKIIRGKRGGAASAAPSDRRQSLVDGLSLQGCFSALQRREHHVPVREAHGRNMIAEAACSRSWRRTRRRCGWHRKGLAAPSCIPAEVFSICRYAGGAASAAPFLLSSAYAHGNCRGKGGLSPLPKPLRRLLMRRTPYSRAPAALFPGCVRVFSCPYEHPPAQVDGRIRGAGSAVRLDRA